MKKQAFGAIELLIGLVITAVIFMISTNALKGVSSLKLNGSSVNSESVEEHVDRQVEEIQNMRRQTIDYNRQFQQENF